MGLFKQMRDMQQAVSAGGGQGLAGLGAMGGGMGAQAATAQAAQRLHAAGVEAPGVIHAIRPTGRKDFGGGQQVEFDVSIRPAGAEAYETTIQQSMLDAQLEGLSDGAPITVKYDPESPSVALIYGW